MQKRGMEKQLTNVRIALTVDEKRYTAEANIFIETYGPPPRWHGRVWALTPAEHMKKGTKATMVIRDGNSVEIVIQRPGARGAYDFQGEGLPPAI